MAANGGYAETSVQDVLTRARVSRRAFYELFNSKLDCFLAAFDGARDILLGRMLDGTGAESVEQLRGPGDPVGKFERGMSAYLNAVAEELAFARLFLVDSFAAGPEAVRRRTVAQGRIVDAMAWLLGVTGPEGRYTCESVITSVAARVSALLASDDEDAVKKDAIRALGPPLARHVRRLWVLGAFAEPSGSAAEDREK